MKNMIHEPIVQFIEKYLKKLDINFKFPPDVIIDNSIMNVLFGDYPYNAQKKLISGEELNVHENDDLNRIADRLDNAVKDQSWNFELNVDKLAKDPNNDKTVEEMVIIFAKYSKITKKEYHISEETIRDTWKHGIMLIDTATQTIKMNVSKWLKQWPVTDDLDDITNLLNVFKNFEKVRFNDYKTGLNVIKETFVSIHEQYQNLPWVLTQGFGNDDRIMWGLFLTSLSTLAKDMIKLTLPINTDGYSYKELKADFKDVNDYIKEMQKFVPYLIYCRQHNLLPDINEI
jgi:hypothetical protein